MAECLFVLKEYEQAYGISHSLLEKSGNYMPEINKQGFKEILFSSKVLLNHSKPQVFSGNKEEIIPFVIENSSIYIHVKINDTTLKVLFDTGGARNMIAKGVADKLGIIQHKDTEKYAYGSVLAVVDSICIGNTIFTNQLFGVDENTELMKVADIIIGTDILRNFPEFEIDYRKSKLVFRNYLPDRKNTPQNLAVLRFPFIKLNIAGVNTTFLWDTGSNASVVRDVFYEKNKENLPVVPEFEVGTANFSDSEFKIEGSRFSDDVIIKVNNKNIAMSNTVAIKNFPIIEGFIYSLFYIDGFMAVDLLGINKLIVSYNKLYIMAE